MRHAVFALENTVTKCKRSRNVLDVIAIRYDSWGGPGSRPIYLGPGGPKCMKYKNVQNWRHH